MSVFIYIWKTQSNFTSNFFKPKYPQIDIGARMNWSTSEILTSFKKLAVVYYQVWKLWALLRGF